MYVQCGRFTITWDARFLGPWWPQMHVTGCCVFWLWWGPLEMGITRC